VQRFNSKVALVTGGASGLGKAIAERLACDGARVVITDIQRDLGRDVAAQGGFGFLEQDVSSEAQWIKIVRMIEEQYGLLEILVNNAGILGPRDAVSPEDTSLVSWRKIFAVNVESVFLGCRTVIPTMRRAGGGSIINVSSIASLIGTPFSTAYGASKAAVQQFTKSVAQHCAEHTLNIRCNSVHPGMVLTQLWLAGAEQSARERGIPTEQVISDSRSKIPMGDFTLAEDVAAAVSFLASEDARHITGSKLIVDGGMVNCGAL
jgi:3(or 17)beta-hydroxysteroid dehydrogenase